MLEGSGVAATAANEIPLIPSLFQTKEASVSSRFRKFVLPPHPYGTFRKRSAPTLSAARKDPPVITPFTSVNELVYCTFHALASIGPLGKAEFRPTGKPVIKTSAAELVELFVKPKISPVTVPGTFPKLLLNENVKSSALANPLKTVDAASRNNIVKTTLLERKKRTNFITSSWVWQ